MKNFYSSLKEVLTIPFYKVTLNKYEFIGPKISSTYPIYVLFSKKIGLLNLGTF